MKRRSMLGRRQSRMLQSPSAPASNVRPPPPTRNAPHTPEQQSGLFENPFRTPSVNGSLSEVGENDNAWSVFKSVRHGLKTPPEQEPANQFRNPLKSLNNRETSIKNNGNRKREQKNYEKIASVLAVPSATTRKFQISVYKHQLDQSYLPPVKQNDDQPFRSFSGHSATAPGKTADDNDTSFRSNGLSQPMKAFEFSFQKNDRGADAGGPKIVSMPVVHEEKSRMDVNTPASPWDHQDIRNLSPPWSNGLNTISDFNLLTPQNSKRAASSPLLADSRSSSLSNSMAYPLEATVLENTVVQVEVTPEAKTAAQPGNEVIGDEKLDVKTALSEVSLGVDSIDLLDTHGMGEWSSTSWTSRTVLRRVSEELEETLVEEKENKPHPVDVTPPQDEEPMEEQMSQLSNGSVLSPSQGTSSASKSSEKRIKSHLEKLIDLNSRIEEAEDERDSAEQRIRQLEEQIHLAIEDRRSAEDKRRKLEYKRKMLNYELLEGMSEAPSIFAVQSSKRRKIGPPSAKKGPSFVATKLLKRDFARTPVRTPRRSVANSSMSMNSFINPFTPKTLRKNINDQYDQIFGN